MSKLSLCYHPGMQTSLRSCASVIKSILALVLALNALGWASHVDVPVQGDHALSTHAHTLAYAQPADLPTDGGDLAVSVNDHCGHAHAHHAGLVGLADHLTTMQAGDVATPVAPSYISLALEPPLDPPIA